MKRIFAVLISSALLAIVADNSFVFYEKSFGKLKPSKVRCENVSNNDNAYSDLSINKAPSGKLCLIGYLNEGTFVRTSNGDLKSTMTIVTVSANKFDDPKRLKENWINIKTKRYGNIQAGTEMLGSKEGKLMEWISEPYYISVSVRGERLPEVDQIIDLYFEDYPPTYTVTESDLDYEHVNERELYRYLQIIQNAEKYRRFYRPKQDRYVGIMAQCHHEAVIRSAAGLCSDALIQNAQTSQRNKAYIGCPISMNFDKSERDKLWEEFKQKALNAEDLDFDPRSRACTFIGLQWYFEDVVDRLLLTKPEILIMYKSDVPDQYLPPANELMILLNPQD